MSWIQGQTDPYQWRCKENRGVVFKYWLLKTLFTSTNIWENLLNRVFSSLSRTPDDNQPDINSSMHFSIVNQHQIFLLISLVQKKRPQISPKTQTNKNPQIKPHYPAKEQKKKKIRISGTKAGWNKVNRQTLKYLRLFLDYIDLLQNQGIWISNPMCFPSNQLSVAKQLKRSNLGLCEK